MPTKLGICNSALLKLGMDRISSLTDNTKSSNFLNEQYPKLRRKALRMHPWNFATKRATLAKLVSTPDWGYTTEFALPADCLRILNTEYDMEFGIEGGKLLCDEDSVKIRYIADIVDETLFDDSFAEALSSLIAAEAAYPLCQSRELAAQMFELLKKDMSDARTFDSQSGSSMDEVEATTWLDSRV